MTTNPRETDEVAAARNAIGALLTNGPTQIGKNQAERLWADCLRERLYAGQHGRAAERQLHD